MGNKCSGRVAGDVIRPFLSPPTSKLALTSEEVYDLLKDKTEFAQIILWDNIYDTIEVEDVEKLLLANINTDYIIERSDCDDFSIHLCSRFREHAYNMNGNGGPLFGILTGNLKVKEDDPARPHAVCFFIDSKRELYIVDGMYNQISQLTPSMVVSTILV